MTTRTRRSLCANCEGEIPWFPVFRRDLLFCCTGCADGGPCVCLYEQDLADDGVDHLGLPFPMPADEPAPTRASDERTFAERTFVGRRAD